MPLFTVKFGFILSEKPTIGDCPVVPGAGVTNMYKKNITQTLLNERQPDLCPIVSQLCLTKCPPLCLNMTNMQYISANKTVNNFSLFEASIYKKK